MIDSRKAFVERLGEHDLMLLAGSDVAPEEATRLRDRLLAEPSLIDSYLGDVGLFDSLFRSDQTDTIRVLSPTLAFAVLVHRTMRDLHSANYVSEWVGAGERLPVFDVASLREFIDDLTRRFLMIDLLASFTRVASGSTVVRTRHGYRRRRFSELDPVSLAEVVSSLPNERRAAGYRRLGDVALFLTGVFPDHTSRHPMSHMRRVRLVRATGMTMDVEAAGEYVHFLEAAGTSWYERAAGAPTTYEDGRRVLDQMATNFVPARRFLNYLADTYLHRYETGLMNPI